MVFGVTNPALGKFLGNSLKDIGYGLATSPTIGTAFGAAAVRQQEQQPARDAYEIQQKQEAERQAEIAKAAERTNATVEYFKSKGYDDLVAAAAGGAPMGNLWTEAINRGMPQSPAEPIRGIEINGQLVNPITGQPMGDFRSPAAGPTTRTLTPQEIQQMGLPPGAYQQDNEGKISQIGGSRGGMPTATLQKEIFEADEGVQAGQNVIKALDTALELNKTAWDGPAADLTSAGAALFGNPEAVQTQELKNIVTANALESLKATFGAAPTEGERKILLDIQGSVTQSRPVREAIFKRAKAAAERRLQFNAEKARGLRSGEYFDAGYSPVSGAGAFDPVSAADALLNSGKY